MSGSERDGHGEKSSGETNRTTPRLALKPLFKGIRPRNSDSTPRTHDVTSSSTPSTSKKRRNNVVSSGSENEPEPAGKKSNRRIGRETPPVDDDNDSYTDQQITRSKDPYTEQQINKSKDPHTDQNGDRNNTLEQLTIGILERLVDEVVDLRSETRERLHQLELQSRETNKIVFNATSKIQQIHARLQLENLKSVKPTFTEDWMAELRVQILGIFKHHSMFPDKETIFGAICAMKPEVNFDKVTLNHIKDDAIGKGLSRLSTLRNKVTTSLTNTSQLPLAKAKEALQSTLKIGHVDGSRPFISDGLFAKLRLLHFSGMQRQRTGTKDDNTCLDYNDFLAEYEDYSSEKKKAMKEEWISAEETERKKLINMNMQNQKRKKTRGTGAAITFNEYAATLAAEDGTYEIE